MGKLLGPLSDVEIAFLIDLAGDAPEFVFRSVGIRADRERGAAALGATLATLRALIDDSGDTTVAFDDALDAMHRAVVDAMAVYSLRVEVSTVPVTSIIIDAGSSSVEILVGEKRLAAVHDLDGEMDAAALLQRRIDEVPVDVPTVVRRDSPEGTKWYGMFGGKTMSKMSANAEMTPLGALDKREFSALILSGGGAEAETVGGGR
jgi:hypothetical protein